MVVYKFADQLQSFPVNLFGASMALAALPTLSSEAGGKSKEDFKRTFLTSFHQLMFLVIPASVILLVLRVPLVRLVFGAPSFPWEATLETALTLGIFSFGIFSQSGVFLTTRAFYAMKDTKTPVMVNIFTLTFAFVLSLLFVQYFKYGVWALALSYTLASFLDLVFMLLILNKKVGGFSGVGFFKPLSKISISALLMGVFLYFPMKALDSFVFDTTRVLPLLFLTLIAGLVGAGAYLFFTKIFKVEEIDLFYKLMGKFSFGSKNKISYVTEAETQSEL